MHIQDQDCEMLPFCVSCIGSLNFVKRKLGKAGKLKPFTNLYGGEVRSSCYMHDVKTCILSLSAQSQS